MSLRSGLFGYNGYLLGANMAVTILAAWDWKSILVTVVLSPLVIVRIGRYFHTQSHLNLARYSKLVAVISSSILTHHHSAFRY